MQLFPVFAIHGQETRWRQRAPEVLGAGFHLGSPEGSLCFSAVLNFSVTNGINGNHPSGSSVFIQVLSRLTGASLSIVVPMSWNLYIGIRWSVSLNEILLRKHVIFRE